MSEEYNKLIEKSLEYLKNIEDFAEEQTPLVIEEFYKWCFLHHGFLAIVGFIGIVSSIFYHKYIMNKYGNYIYVDKYHEEVVSATILPTIIVPVICIPMFLSNIYYLMKLWVAPRIYLIEYLKDLIS